MIALGQIRDGITRRLLLEGALKLGGAAAVTAVSPVAAAALAAHVPITARTGRPVASITRNIVETDSGRVSGFARDGVIGFRGIPYGASTEGHNRFMPPQKPLPWAGVRSTLSWGWVSPSVYNSSVSERRAGWTHDDEAFMFEWEDGNPSEDCLRLNVWTPALDHKKRAVMFWVHGGGMTTGSCYELRAYDGENLARQQDVVVVSINHRLAVHGFLNLAEYDERYADSGNASMLDIIAALKWVTTNITNFGGDPGRVLLFGQSGGGAKVGTIMGMPTARGLFQRASIQSGSHLLQSTMDASQQLAHATLKALGLSKSSIGRLHTDFTFQQIVEAGIIAQRNVMSGPAPTDGRRPGWGPVVDGRLIPRDTWGPAAPEPSADLPLIVGTVLNESLNSVQMGDASLEGMDIAEAKRRLSSILGKGTDHVMEAIRKLYPRAMPFEHFSLAGAMRQRINACRQAEMKDAQGAPAYLYRSEWRSSMCDGRARAFHTSELPFCFSNVEACAKLTGNTPESHQLASRMSGAWAAFAKTGKPNHDGLPQWTAYNAALPTMIFNTTCFVKNDPDGDIRKAILETMA